MLQLLHHYNNVSVNSSPLNMPIYDGENYNIPPHRTVVLVPCNSNDPRHIAPCPVNCMLLTRTGVQPVDKTPLLIIYVIDNTTDIDLVLMHGDLLGTYYTGPHDTIKAERCQMMTTDYEEMIAEEIGSELVESLHHSYPSPKVDTLDDAVALIRAIEDTLPHMTNLYLK